jgi:hypothetical protein
VGVRKKKIDTEKISKFIGEGKFLKTSLDKGLRISIDYLKKEMR